MADDTRAILADESKFNAASNVVFDKVDADGSGRISKNELRAVMILLATEAGIPQLSDEQVDEAMRELDADRSGSLDREEFKVVARAIFEGLAS